MDKKRQLKIWALQKGYGSITALAKATGLSRQALYAAIHYQPGKGINPPIGSPALIKIAWALDLTEGTINDWFNGRC
jgi:DNA-binding phage protein